MRRIATPIRARAARTAAAALLTAAGLLVAACGPESTTTDLDRAMQALDANRYDESARLAKAAQTGSSDMRVRQEAALVAGCAEYELGRWDDAKASLAVAAKSADARVSGRAMAMQAAVAVNQQRWDDAARLYGQAADRLVGADAAHAREQAADARQMAEAARRPATPAAPAPGTAANAGTAPAPAPDAGRWTVVAGTFTSETAARQRATTIADEAKRAGFATPKVLPSSAGGRRVWIVEVGIFDTKAKAEAAKKKIPVTDAAVSPSLTTKP